ncbi:hypothetical protein HPT29_027495 (plasmid) [Microvirga terrae]|uniref:Uncharacterized protein n=1 Tax=Microvirga terrae TaxID=2740529 RepID=A0ABY5S300_9HYPH|nr:hypothetical protein [Microvirga terrae]UVF22767.1 hypothetical protein HPT29_027495 [Microvirga terrae]
MALKWRKTGTHYNGLIGRVMPTLEHYWELTPEEALHIEEVAARSGYKDPPPELEPEGVLGEDDRWDDLWAWLHEHTDDGHDAFLVYLCRRYPGQSISDVYAGTDSWVKSKLGLRGYN